MTHVFASSAALNDGYTGLLAGLEIEFGHDAVEVLAARFLEAETADFLWECRVAERKIGTFQSIDDDEEVLDRIAIASVMKGGWYVGIGLIDGDGRCQSVMGIRRFESAPDAGIAFDLLR